MFMKAFRDLKKAALVRKPDVVVLVDFPDFNLKLAKTLKKKGFKVLLYLSSNVGVAQIRLRTVRKYIDLILVILPFEKQWYERNGIQHVEYVGSPLVREIHSDLSKNDFCSKYGLDATVPIISLLPGSRHKEIVRSLPVMLEAARRLEQRRAGVQFLVALASTRKMHEVEDAVAELKAKGMQPPGNLTLVEGETVQCFKCVRCGSDHKRYRDA